MTRQVAAVAVKAVAVVVMTAVPTTAIASVAVTAGHTASLSTRAKSSFEGVLTYWHALFTMELTNEKDNNIYSY